MEIREVQDLADAVISEVERVILGKRETVTQAVITLLCNGHLLVEDIPGVGKTTLAKAVALTTGGQFHRMQFTPDLLPSDVTGSSIFNQQTGAFEFRAGPVFANVVLVDEINRATPKTQSSLLEAMEERQVTSDGVTRQLPTPFFVVATQNNVELTGTYPLPEAQVDRFFARVSLGYPDRDTEVAVIRDQQVVHPIETIRQVTELHRLVEAQAVIRNVFVHDRIREYVVDVVRATREHGQLSLGSSPRGSIYVAHAAQAVAALDGADHVRPDDVKRVAPMVLAHRVIARGEVRARGTSNESIIQQILETLPVPVPVA